MKMPNIRSKFKIIIISNFKLTKYFDIDKAYKIPERHEVRK